LIKDRDALLAFYDFPAEHWKHLRTTDEMDKRFFLTVRLQASPDWLFCPAELRHPRAGFWPPLFPLRHESFVTSLRLGGNQHLAVA
jgi:hypothetical protein